MTLTATEYSSFQRAYDYFNRTLFLGELPQVLVTLQHQRRARGYFCAEAFQSRQSGEVTHELALNPDYFGERTDAQILSTLVHEMTHVWQQAYGKPGRRRYHNREWARYMKSIGLQPTTTGEPGGRETGESVTHFIVDGGPFALACDALLSDGFRLTWQTRPLFEPAGARGIGVTRAPARSRFECPVCSLKASARPTAQLLCGVCFQSTGEVAAMLSDVEDDDDALGQAGEQV